MADNLYEVEVFVNINLVPRGGSGVLFASNQANIPGFSSTTAAPGGLAGVAQAMQTMRLQACEMVPNAIATPPTAANFQTAIASCGTDIQNQLTAQGNFLLGIIQNWVTGAQ